MKKRNVKKGFSIALIFIFMGVTIAPSINADFIKTENEQVVITVDVGGIKGISPYTLQLTNKELSELQQLIDDTKNKLDMVRSEDEAVTILKDAIQLFHKYGVFGDLSIEKVQEILFTSTPKFIQNLPSGFDQSKLYNLYCLLFVTMTGFVSIDFNIMAGIIGSYYLLGCLLITYFPKLLDSRLAYLMFWEIPIISALISISKPFRLMSLYMDLNHVQWGSHGDVYSVGLMGFKGGELRAENEGVFGFTGFKVTIPGSERPDTLILGRAFAVGNTLDIDFP